MVSKKNTRSICNVATGTAASFGVAMTSMYLTPEIQADIVDITWAGNATATNPFMTGTAPPFNLDMDQVATATGTRDFVQWNDEFSTTGRCLLANGFTLYGDAVMSGLTGARVATLGEVIDPNTFVPNTTGIGAGTEFDGTGTAFIAFREANTGNVGWFKISFEADSAIVYGPGQFADNGETVTVGDGTSPCDFELGDVNQDEMIGLSDIPAFVSVLSSGGNQCEADINGDGEVSLTDIPAFVELLSGN